MQTMQIRRIYNTQLSHQALKYFKINKSNRKNKLNLTTNLIFTLGHWGFERYEWT